MPGRPSRLDECCRPCYGSGGGSNDHRVPTRPSRVPTFHSFGLQVIADVETSPPEVSPLAKRDTLLEQAIRGWVFELPHEVAEYGAYFSNEYRSPFDFGTLQDYTDFVRSCDRRALSGAPQQEPAEERADAASGRLGGSESFRNHLQVDSLEELLTANFLALHGIRFEYRADYGVVLMSGFPSRKQDDAILAMVLPPARGAVAFGEERRLFYVATTRARRGLYLVVDDRRPSSFVWELLGSASAFRSLGSFAQDGAPPCPACPGLLVPSDSEKNLRCTNHPICRHLAPRCNTCQTGYLVATDHQATCTNDDCGQTSPLCPVCRLGVVTPRNGPYGPFWGCSGYSAEPPCKYKRNG